MYQASLGTCDQTAHKGTLVLDPFPAAGHFNGLLNFAAWLKDSQKYRVVFVGEIAFKSQCEGSGFEYFELPSLIFIPEKAEIKEKGVINFFLSNFYENRHIALQKRFEACALLYKKTIDMIRPDAIILDDHYATKAFFYEQYNLPIFLASTMISPERRSNIPPFHFTFVPKLNGWSKLYCNLLWEFVDKKRFLSRVSTNMICFGRPNRRFAKKKYANSKYTRNESRCLGTGIHELPLINLYPKSFDFEERQEQNLYLYFEEFPKLNIYSTIETRLESVLLTASKKGIPIIYCSLGTVNSLFEKRVEKFFKKMIKIASIHKDYHFILNVGENIDVNFFHKTTNNISMFKKVQQLYVLKYCAVMVSHGGLNSIKECIEATVPMLVCPLTDLWDQPGNAARIMYHQIGEAGSITSDGVVTLGKKLQQMVENHAFYKSNMDKMKAEITQSKWLRLKILADKISQVM